MDDRILYYGFDGSDTFQHVPRILKMDLGAGRFGGQVNTLSSLPLLSDSHLNHFE